MSTDHRLLMIFAHPDDESFGFAGTMLALADAGVKMSLIVATRGEEGEILVPGLATKENLGEVREGELRAAMEIVGIDDIHFLGFRDSGMPNTPPNHDPRAFVNQDVNKVAATIADIIAELRPTIILTYGPDGIYAHPDHIMVNTVAWPAVLKAGEDGRWKTPNLYFSAAPKERMRRMAELPNGPFASMDPDLVASLGMPASEITTWIDTTPFADRKREILMAHRTQVGEEGPFNQLPPEMRRIWFSVETMRTIPLPWNPDPEDVIAELLPAAAHDHPFRV